MKHILLLALSLFGVRAMAQDNVVVIVVDQLSAWASDPAQRAPLDLPAIDSLAAQGTTFSRAYATSPVCAANRLALFAGRYPFFGTDKLQPGTPTLGTILEDAGFDTGYIGKWHLSPVADPSQYVAPADRPGWRYFAGKEGQPHQYVTGSSFKQNDPTPISTGPWEPSWNTTEALRFIRADRAGPFCLVVNYGPPHPTKDWALMPPETVTASQVVLRPNVDPADEGLAKARYAAYLSAVALTDTEIGVLLSEIDLLTTFVLFTSDHGDMLYSHGLPQNQQKRRPYEESAHVPMILAGPGIPAGATDSGMISTVDILPSLLTLVGAAIPPGVQGEPFAHYSPIYYGQDDPKNSWLGQRWRGLVDGTLKYAVAEDGTELLFDLFSDPFELIDLAPNPVYAPTLEAMRAITVTTAAGLGDGFFVEDGKR